MGMSEEELQDYQQWEQKRLDIKNTALTFQKTIYCYKAKKQSVIDEVVEMEKEFLLRTNPGHQLQHDIIKPVVHQSNLIYTFRLIKK